MLFRSGRPLAGGGSVPGALWLLPGTYPGGQNLPQPPDTGFLQRAWYSSVRSGPALGKPPKAPGLSRQAKKLEYQDNCDRNTVEGVFGTVKTAYGLDRVMARLQETAVCVIGVALLLSNLSLSLRAALALFCLMLLLFVLLTLRSRA